MSYAATLLTVAIADRLSGKKETIFTVQELRELQFSLASQLIAGTLDPRIL